MTSYMTQFFQGSFLSLEIVESKVRFSWQVDGGEATSITHPKDLVFTALRPGEKYEKLWFEVVASRLANVGRLTVRRLNESVVDTVEDSSAPIPTTITVDNETSLFVGGAPNSYTVRREIHSFM